MLFKTFLMCTLCLTPIIPVSVSIFCDYNVKIEQNLSNNGFHRNLSYHIDFSSQSNEWKWTDDGECAFALEQELPAGIYASPDEVENYRNNYFSGVVFRNTVDVEIPANDASPILIRFVINKINDKTIFSLPIHARYHPATVGGGFAKNEIPSPKLYLNCRDKRLQKCVDINKGTSKVNSMCMKARPEDCPWKEIPTTIVTDKIIWEVPVGNSEHFYVVVLGTAFVVTLGSLYLLKIMHDIKTPKLNAKVKNK